MREYELIYIVHPDLDESATNDILEKVKGWIAAAGGSVVKQDVWGKRQMAYKIRKQKEGQYVLVQFQSQPAFANELDHNLRFLEPVMRFLITAVE